MHIKLILILLCIPLVVNSLGFGGGSSCTTQFFLGFIFGQSFSNDNDGFGGGNGLFGGGHASCPKDWVKLKNGQCYLFSEIPKSWYEARIDCHRRGGYLTIVGSDKENECIVGYLEKNAPDDRKYWNGANDIWEEDSFMWDSKYKIFTDKTFVDFQPDQPDDDGDGEDCVLFNDVPADSKWGWADFPCDEYHHYVCERDPERKFKCNVW